MKALAAMSGGVDSAVCAHLLMKNGYDTTGINLRLFSGEGCGSEAEAHAAKQVADILGIPFITRNYEKEFHEQVIQRFIDTYEKGSTPNPCVECNRYIKFQKICEIAENEGFDRVATGHYAVKGYDSATGRHLIFRATDKGKDQSYVLYGLSQQQLARVLFPLGELTKPQVREIAQGLGLPNSQKKDSQDICFVPDGDYAAFIEHTTGRHYPHGWFVHTDGTVLGEHKGLIRYTVGQRKGLGLALPHPMFVLKKDIPENRVILCDGDELYTKTVKAENINFLPFARLESDMRVTAKTRYRQKEQPATLIQTGDDSVIIEFDQPVRAAAPGQSAVFYDGDLLIGGGTIK